MAVCIEVICAYAGRFLYSTATHGGAPPVSSAPMSSLARFISIPDLSDNYSSPRGNRSLRALLRPMAPPRLL